MILLQFQPANVDSRPNQTMTMVFILMIHHHLKNSHHPVTSAITVLHQRPDERLPRVFSFCADRRPEVICGKE